jgi:tripartite-type tricarboxylate transporter receptor subunit TctC
MPKLALMTALALLATHSVASAQDFPTRPITIIAPSAPGGVVDRIARTVADRLSASWKQPVVVENKSGANHLIGAQFVAKSNPDGYTLIVSPEGPFVATPYLSKDPGPDLARELAPVSGLLSTDAALVAANNLGVEDVKGLLALAKSKPGALSYGTFGFGSSGHLGMELLQNMTGTKMVPVHYKGATPAFTDVLGGHIATMLINPGTAIPAASQGKVRLLAIASPKRLPQYPDVPTVIESGVPDFVAGSWFGLFAPAGTPPEIIGKINQEVQAMLADLEREQKFLLAGAFSPMKGSADAFATFIRADAAKWSALIKAAKIGTE